MDLFVNKPKGNIIKISCIPTEMFLIATQSWLLKLFISLPKNPVFKTKGANKI